MNEFAEKCNDNSLTSAENCRDTIIHVAFTTPLFLQVRNGAAGIKGHTTTLLADLFDYIAAERKTTATIASCHACVVDVVAALVCAAAG